MIFDAVFTQGKTALHTHWGLYRIRSFALGIERLRVLFR